MAGSIGAASATLVALLLITAGTATSKSQHQLLPDLEVLKPDEVYLVKRAGGAARLRTSNTVANVGTGPLEIYPDSVTNDCDEDGDQSERLAFQSIYSDSDAGGSDGHFIRPGWGSRESEDTAPPADVAAGCMRFHPAHDHWHFDNFARYTLIREQNGRVVGEATKVSFCIIDTGRPRPGLPGSPTQGYYPRDPASPKFPTCSETSVDGLSIGWEDTYAAGLPGQGIDVSELRKGGEFCLVLEADPASAELPNGQLVESDEDDNSYTQRLRLSLGTADVRRLKGPCKAAAPTS